MEHNAMTSNHRRMDQLLTLPSAMTQYEMPVEVNIVVDHMAAKIEQDCHTATAKSLQSCLTLRHPIDSSPPGSSVHGIFQARVLEWGAIAFSEDCHKEYTNSVAGMFLKLYWRA